MAHEPRSRYEFEERSRAEQRGERLRLLADTLIDEMIGAGMSVSRNTLRPLFFRILADDIYGNQTIDIPNLIEGDR